MKTAYQQVIEHLKDACPDEGWEQQQIQLQCKVDTLCTLMRLAEAGLHEETRNNVVDYRKCLAELEAFAYRVTEARLFKQSNRKNQRTEAEEYARELQSLIHSDLCGTSGCTQRCQELCKRYKIVKTS